MHCCDCTTISTTWLTWRTLGPCGVAQSNQQQWFAIVSSGLWHNSSAGSHTCNKSSVLPMHDRQKTRKTNIASVEPQNPNTALWVDAWDCSASHCTWRRLVIFRAECVPVAQLSNFLWIRCAGSLLAHHHMSGNDREFGVYKSSDVLLWNASARQYEGDEWILHECLTRTEECRNDRMKRAQQV